MRVIGGEFRSRRLKSVSGEATRPTPDRLRETLFDILAGRIRGVTFADAYAGTGAVGIEALSRGAAHAYFLEKNRVALEAIRENLAALGVEARATVVAGAVARTLGLWRADIVFVDPPYALDREYAAVFAALGASPPPLAIVQHSVRFALPAAEGLEHTRDVRQGDNVLSFYVGRTPRSAAGPLGGLA
jgi:16S rRNA (guanine(966)-N(2))-methyltransferase RsmD